MKKENIEINNLKYNNSNIQLGKLKIPPQDIKVEEALLGSILIDKKSLDKIIDILHPYMFYKKEHKIIYECIKDLFNNSEAIDIYTVSNYLKKKKIIDKIGFNYIIELTQKISSSAHIEYYSGIIQEKYILRKLIQISNEIIDKSFDDSIGIEDILDFSEKKLFEITNQGIKTSYYKADSLISDALNKLSEQSKKEGILGLPTGFKDLDNVTYGWQDSDLIILAGRPGMGKTAFILSMARNMTVDYKIPLAIFSLEMSSIQLITRIISNHTGISSEKIRKAQLSDKEWKELYTKIKDLEEAPLYIDDTPSLSIFDLKAKCRRLVAHNGVKIIIIDYLQLMTTSNKSIGNREQEISLISRSLKSIAKELNIPIIALSQLSRSVETRGGSKRPLLSDLRESGAIEQDADIVSFIYRPEYYKLEYWDDGDLPCKNQAELIIAKHRNGALENIRLNFIKDQTKFIDLQNQSNNDIIEIPSSMNYSKNKINDIHIPPYDSFEDFEQFNSSINEDDDINL